MSATVSVLANASAGSPAEARIAAYDWQALTAELDGLGCAVFPKLLTPKECRAVAGLYPNETLFRSHIMMARHGFGKGEYRYCKYPLPDLLAEALAQRFTRALRQSPTSGTSVWAWRNAFPPTTLRS
jgi:uncharacterized protein